MPKSQSLSMSVSYEFKIFYFPKYCVLKNNSLNPKTDIKAYKFYFSNFVFGNFFNDFILKYIDDVRINGRSWMDDLSGWMFFFPASILNGTLEHGSHGCLKQGWMNHALETR